MDVCNLVISREGYGEPTDNKDAVNRLVKNAIISEDLGSRLRDMIRFRNLLVHRYYTVDDQQTFKYLKNELRKELIHVRDTMGAIVERDIEFVNMLPKTRSGKIMQRVMKALWTSKDLDDLSTIGEEGSVKEIKEAIKRMK